MMMPFPYTYLLPLFFLACAASVLPAYAHDPRLALPDTWHHPPGHPINALFRRQTQNGTELPTDGGSYPPVGSQAWVSAYPQGPLDPGAMPQAWKDALNNAVQEGKIPDIPQSTLVNATPVYPHGVDPNSPGVCSGSGTAKCRIQGDYWDGPSGYVTLSFDDGPLPPSTALYNFLRTNNLKATHFFIGKNIIAYPQTFLTAYNTNLDDIAVHTWSHPYLTTLSNEQIIAELAYTMQLIYDSTGGRVPRFFRPPYGDTDTRVHSLAKILGLTTIVWNQDTEDWQLTSNGITPAQISRKMQEWLAGPKSPGLVILEHELSNQSVQAFLDNYHFIVENGWKTVSAAEMDGQNAPYQNAQGTTGAVTSAAIIAKQNNAVSSLPASNTASQSTTASSTSSASSGSAKPSHLTKAGGASGASVATALTLSVTVLASVAGVWQL
ncbi:hypothetical protein BJV74DRAFT_324907 [Russula compacta]|nr:hypothetical protein BJV74DRAFT_324907 [Russula compacta]